MAKSSDSAARRARSRKARERRLANIPPDKLRDIRRLARLLLVNARYDKSVMRQTGKLPAMEPDLARWFGNAVRSWLSGRSASLEAALGFKPQGRKRQLGIPEKVRQAKKLLGERQRGRPKKGTGNKSAQIASDLKINSPQNMNRELSRYSERFAAEALTKDLIERLQRKSPTKKNGQK